jgi:hypothetical protein
MDEDICRLYVARNKATGLYHRNMRNFLVSNKEWMEAAKPSMAEVRGAMQLAEMRSSRWTEDINEADVWDDHDIRTYQQYLPYVDFVAVKLSAEPLNPAAGS